MDFLWPNVLLSLGLIPFIVAFYVWILRRRCRFAVRYSSLSLVQQATRHPSPLRRHLPFCLFIAALTSLVLNEIPPRASAVAAQPIPPALDGLIAACLEKRREDRPQTIGECSDVLEALAVRHRWTQGDAAAAWAAHLARARAA